MARYWRKGDENLIGVAEDVLVVAFRLVAVGGSEAAPRDFRRIDAEVCAYGLFPLVLDFVEIPENSFVGEEARDDVRMIAVGAISVEGFGAGSSRHGRGDHGDHRANNQQTHSSPKNYDFSQPYLQSNGQQVLIGHSANFTLGAKWLGAAMTVQPSDSILIVDFGSQVTQLIARRVREAGVYCEIAPFNAAAEAFERLKPKGIILSGGPSSVTWEDSPRAPQHFFDTGLPILAICYGQQTMAQQLGGRGRDVRQ